MSEAREKLLREANVIGCGGGEHCVCQPGYGHKKNMLIQTPISVPLSEKSKEELVRIVEMMQEDMQWYVAERNRLLAAAPAAAQPTVEYHVKLPPHVGEKVVGIPSDDEDSQP